MVRASIVIQLDSLSGSLAHYLRNVKLFCNYLTFSAIDGVLKR
jgi:hypothetical protein